MMGSGKTVVGKKLAKKINFSFIDTDKLIENKIGKPINKIFEEDGEEHFRELEEQVIISILNKKNYVISLGGGAIINNNIRRSIEIKSFNIYLEVEIKTLTKRLENSKNRPLIQNKNIKKILGELIKKRKKFYQKADLIIKNNLNLNLNELINNIIQKL